MMDFDLWLRAGLVCEFGYLHQPVARFRRYAQTKSGSRTDLAAQEILTVYTKFFGRSSLSPELIQVQREAWSSAYFYAARAWYAANRLTEARQNLWKSLRTFPWIVRDLQFWRFLLYINIALLLGGRQAYIFKISSKIWHRLRGLA